MPSRGRLKAFMEWTVKTSEGMFEPDIVESTLKNKWYCFRSMYQRKTYNVITDEFGKDILAVSIHGISLCGLSNNLCSSLGPCTRI